MCIIFAAMTPPRTGTAQRRPQRGMVTHEIEHVSCLHRSFMNSNNYSDPKRQNVWSSNYEYRASMKAVICRRNDDDSDQSLFDDEKEFHVQNSPSKDSMVRTAEPQPQKVELSEEEKKVYKTCLFYSL